MLPMSFNVRLHWFWGSKFRESRWNLSNSILVSFHASRWDNTRWLQMMSKFTRIKTCDRNIHYVDVASAFLNSGSPQFDRRNQKYGFEVSSTSQMRNFLEPPKLKTLGHCLSHVLHEMLVGTAWFQPTSPMHLLRLSNAHMADRYSPHFSNFFRKKSTLYSESYDLARLPLTLSFFDASRLVPLDAHKSTTIHTSTYHFDLSFHL